MKDENYHKLLNREKKKPGPKPKIIDAIELDYSDLNSKFNNAMAVIKDFNLSKVKISSHLDITPSHFTHKRDGYRNCHFSIPEKEKIVEYITDLGLKCINI